MNAAQNRREGADNPELMALALYYCGGVGEFVDVEDVFVKAYELAPDRFGWRSKEIPNYKSLSKALRDLEGKYPDFTIRTKDGLSRQLTAEGVHWVTGNEQRLGRSAREPQTNPATRRPTQRLLNELRDSSLVQAYIGGSEPELTRYNLAEVLLLTPDSPAESWRERLEALRAAATAANRHDLVTFLEAAREWVHRLFDPNNGGDHQ